MGGGGGLGSSLGNLVGGGGFVTDFLKSAPGGNFLFGNGGTGGGGGAGVNMPQPTDPGYQSLLDPSTGQLKSQYQIQYNPDTSGLDELKNRALSNSPSQWAQAATAQQGLEQQGLQNAAQQQNASQAAQARDQLASKFGLSPAAQEQLAKTQMRSGQTALQNVGFQGAQARAGIGVQDQSMKSQYLQALPALQNQQAMNQVGVQQSNIGNAINQNTALNQYNLGKYQQQMENWGANNNANAMQGSGGGGKK